MVNYDLLVVLQHNELSDFLLGEGSKYGYVRPETGYQRWNQVADYYKSLTNDDRN